MARMGQGARAADQWGEVKAGMAGTDEPGALPRRSPAEGEHEQDRVAVVLRAGIANVRGPRTHPARVALALRPPGDPRALAADALEDQHIVRPQVGRVAIGQIAVGSYRGGAGGPPPARGPGELRAAF